MNGSRTSLMENMVDGVPAGHPTVQGYTGISVFPSVDAIGEFKVEAENYAAEYGHSVGGVLNVVFKSGTNGFHGTAYEFIRNSVLDANNFFSNSRGVSLPSFKRNQYGGTLGGPLIKNKLFFFAGYQGTKTRSDPADRPGFVPTTRMLAGDFTGCNSPQLRDPVTGTNYPNNQIPPNQFSPQALAIVKRLPAAAGRIPRSRRVDRDER